MKKLLLILPLVLISCKTVQYVPVTSTKTEIQTVHDTTVQVKLDVIRDSITTKDTLSVLSNKYAYSSAKWSNGMLSHTLGIKDVSTPVKVQYITNTVKDSIQVPYKVSVTKEVAKPLNWYEKLCICGFSIVLVIGVIGGLIKMNKVFGWVKFI